MANTSTTILDFSGFDSSRILISKGWKSQAHREFPGKFESRNLSRDNLSRETGRSTQGCRRASDSFRAQALDSAVQL